MPKPDQADYGSYYHLYISQVAHDDLLPALQEMHNETQAFIASIPEEKEGYAYAEGKWTLKQVVQHVIDTERIFAYRALCIARGDKTEFSGYDENEYARQAPTTSRTLTEMAREFLYVRNATLALFNTLDEDMLNRRGHANGVPMTPLAIGFIIAGHERHHMNVIRTKYLKWT